MANYSADVSNDQLRLASENTGLRVAFHGQWYAVAHLFGSSTTEGLTRTVLLSSCSMETPPASIGCQKFIDKINGRFKEV